MNALFDFRFDLPNFQPFELPDFEMRGGKPVFTETLSIYPTVRIMSEMLTPLSARWAAVA
jgi:hypothetical protein